jgi:hypothetical protein
MLNGPADLLFNRWNQAVVLPQRSRAAALPREAKRRVGNKSDVLGRAPDMFQPVWAARKKQVSKADRETLHRMVESHRLELLREWEQKVNPS